MKKIKLEGGLPVVAKKISTFDDMDSDDQLLYNLKLAKWTEKDIHARFQAEGRTGYSQKTIGTRFTRMKRFFSKDLDRRLESGETDWHADDVSLLRIKDSTVLNYLPFLVKRTNAYYYAHSRTLPF